MTNDREKLMPFIKPVAWTPDALIDAGIDAKHVMLWRVDPKRARPERARLALLGRKRTEATTLEYVWGLDLEFLIADPVKLH